MKPILLGQGQTSKVYQYYNTLIKFSSVRTEKLNIQCNHYRNWKKYENQIEQDEINKFIHEQQLQNKQMQVYTLPTLTDSSFLIEIKPKCGQEFNFVCNGKIYTESFYQQQQKYYKRTGIEPCFEYDPKVLLSDLCSSEKIDQDNFLHLLNSKRYFKVLNTGLESCSDCQLLPSKLIELLKAFKKTRKDFRDLMQRIFNFYVHSVSLIEKIDYIQLKKLEATIDSQQLRYEVENIVNNTLNGKIPLLNNKISIIYTLKTIMDLSIVFHVKKLEQLEIAEFELIDLEFKPNRLDKWQYIMEKTHTDDGNVNNF